jgi:Protein of unknown function (DUF1501)
VNRRDFLKVLGMGGVTVLWPWPVRPAAAQASGYEGPLFVSIAAEGGWDVTSFCDPKMNVGGESVINHWAEGASIQTIGGSPILYAPFAHNSDFFPRFYRDMLVVNGVDAQTNAHDAGVRHNWSGRLAPGYPSLAAIAAAAYGPGLPLSFVSYGTYRETAGLIPYTRIESPYALRNLCRPNVVPWGGTVYTDDDELDVIHRYRDERLAAMRGESDQLPRRAFSMARLAEARANAGGLSALAAKLPDDFPDPIDKDGNWNYLLQQVDLALLCYDAGLTVSCDLISWGFDTHANHDADQAASLMSLTNGIEYLWDRAEQMGIADRLVVCITSDFGRTPEYNDDYGKDHWPIGSAIFMQRGAAWANRVVGTTDAGHNAIAVDAGTLAPKADAGVVIRPEHVQAAYRQLAGVADHSIAQRFPLDAEPLDLLDPSLPG